ncbi:MAG: TetR/AcrR family transcriptional regulator [Beijerinckiaceae bacterium]
MPAEEGPRARILAAAAGQLARHGLKRFRVVDVAEVAAMTHPNVYRYFTSKTALLDALVAQWLRPLEERVETVVAAPDPVADKLERMVSAISRAYRTARAEEPELFLAFTEATAARRGVTKKHWLRLRRAFDRVIDAGIASGAISLADRTKAQALLLDSVWRFTDPVSILAETDGAAGLDARLGRVLDASLAALTQRDSSRE